MKHELGGSLNKGSSSGDAKWGTIGRRPVSYFSEAPLRDLHTGGESLIEQGARSERVRQPSCPYRIVVSDLSMLDSRKSRKMKISNLSLTGILMVFVPCSLLRNIQTPVSEFGMQV